MFLGTQNKSPQKTKTHPNHKIQLGAQIPNLYIIFLLYPTNRLLFALLFVGLQVKPSGINLSLVWRRQNRPHLSTWFREQTLTNEQNSDA